MVEFDSREVYGKKRIGQYEFTISRGKVKGRLGLGSKTEEGIFLLIDDLQGNQCWVPAMVALDFCKAVMEQVRLDKEILEKYVEGKSVGSFILSSLEMVSLDSVAALDLTRYLVRLLVKVTTTSIGMRSCVTRAKALMNNPSWQIIEERLKKLAKEGPVRIKEILSEREIEAIAEFRALIRDSGMVEHIPAFQRDILKKVVTKDALLHDTGYIRAKLLEAEEREGPSPFRHKSGTTRDY